MSVPIVYRWDDANAPVARGERRSLCDILHACLVTGYGSKPAAGWTREYVNATFDKAAFRNSAAEGTGFYLQVDGLGGANAFSPVVKAFEVMTSESAGLGPFATTYSNTFQTSSGANTTPHPWVLIADNRAFYLFVWVSESAGALPSIYAQSSTMFFGDLVRWKSSDMFCCALNSNERGGAIGAAFQATSAVGGGYNAIYLPRNSAGVATPVSAMPIRGGGPGTDGGTTGANGLPWSSGDQILITRPHVNDAAAYSLRGWMPGYYYPCHSTPFAHLATISNDGKSFLSVRHTAAGGQYAGSFISLDDWRS